MRKRTFLKLLSAGVASPVAQSLSALPATEKLTNWAGNLTYGTDRLQEADSVDQIRSLLASQEKWKVLGSRHCFNAIADSRHNLLSLKPAMANIAIDEQARTVTVDAGIKYGQLSPVLHRKGFALHNLASLPHISIAGACSTATHGSGEKNGNLATAVSGIEFVTAAGDSRKTLPDIRRRYLSRSRRFAWRLGVITRITLDIQPAFDVGSTSIRIFRSLR